MKKVLFIFAALFAAAFPAQAKPWQSFDQGMAEARARDLPVIVDFSADWCGWCKKMESDVFERSDVKVRLEKEFVTVRVDIDSSSALTYDGKKMSCSDFARMMKVEGIPALIVFTPQGKVMATLEGYVEAKYFLEFMNFLKGPCWKSMNFEKYLRGGCSQSPSR